MAEQNVIIGTAVEDSTTVIWARLEDQSGNLVKQADLSAITWGAYDASGVQVVAPAALTIANVIFDTAKTTADDAAWTKPYGYNFKTTIPVTAFPTSGVKASVEIKCTFTDGSIGHFRGEVSSVVAVYGS